MIVIYGGQFLTVAVLSGIVIVSWRTSVASKGDDQGSGHLRCCLVHRAFLLEYALCRSALIESPFGLAESGSRVEMSKLASDVNAAASLLCGLSVPCW